MQFELKWLAWEITRRCNLRCIHCRSSAEEIVKEHPDPSKEECLRIIDDITSYAKPVMVLTGGEPLLREDFFEIAEYGRRKGLRVCVATNGTLLNDDVCNKFKEVQIKMVSLSLDGPNESVHDNFRNQKGAFQGTINAIRLLKKHDIPFLVNSSFTKRNQDTIPEVYKLSKELGATAWYMFMIVPTGRAEELLEELISQEDYEKILHWHYDMEKNEKNILVRPTCAPQYYRVVLEVSKKEGEKFERRSLKFSTGGAKGCVAGQLICLINVDGDVMPCSYFPLSAGNIKKQSFREIWENSELFKRLRDFSSYKGRCGVCEYINVCGGCRARAYCLKDDYMEEDPYCNYIPRKLR
ncbi:MAG: radical SAM protein [Thermodesulfovibrio sp.]|nr:radical SAM protein [Thermodesulfovibrio sp.]MDW7998144.1 radical SAM protein [Thermodesulfovibrio sp.]